MNDFRIGDLIIGKESSDYNYSITCKRQNFIGRVVQSNPFGRFMKVKVVSSDILGTEGFVYSLEKKHFDFLKDNRRTKKQMEEKTLL